jgi:DNA-binding GntR family transcriptional regulator
MSQAARPVGAQHRSLDEVVRDELQAQIISGHIPPGARLVESSIAEGLGVSRGPVRAAIRQLELEGFVVVSPRRGASVAVTTPAEALACYEVRTVLEALAAELACVRRTDSDIATMREILQRGEALLASGRWDKLSLLNNEFHGALAVASGNSQLVLLMRQYSKRIAWMFNRALDRRGARAWEEHALIVDAVEQRDAPLAVARARAHIQSSREQFLLATPVDAGLSAAPLPSAVGPTTTSRND